MRKLPITLADVAAKIMQELVVDTDAVFMGKLGEFACSSRPLGETRGARVSHSACASSASDRAFALDNR